MNLGQLILIGSPLDTMKLIGENLSTILDVTGVNSFLAHGSSDSSMNSII